MVLCCKGDGEYCPVYDRCKVRKAYGSCPMDNELEVRQLMENGSLDIEKYNSIKPEGSQTGRVYELYADAKIVDKEKVERSSIRCG